MGKLKWEKALGVALLCQIAVVWCYNWKKIHGNKKNFINGLFKALDHGLMILFNHPLTFHDVIVFMDQAQHYFLDIMASLDYILYILPYVNHPPSIPSPVCSDWMGCFTADTRVCDELFHSGVLVWLIWHNFTITSWTTIEISVRYTFPDNIICSTYVL